MAYWTALMNRWSISKFRLRRIVVSTTSVVMQITQSECPGYNTIFIFNALSYARSYRMDSKLVYKSFTEIMSFFLLDICVYANKNKWGFLDAFNLLSFEFATISHKSTFTSSFCEQSSPHLITFRNIWFLQHICSVEKGSECSLCKNYKKITFKF